MSLNLFDKENIFCKCEQPLGNSTSLTWWPILGIHFFHFLCKLQSNLCCWGHLHRTDQSDYRKLILNIEFNLNSLSCIFVLFFFFLNNAWHNYNPLHHNISMHILHTVLYTFPKVLTRRICLTIKIFLSLWSFPLFLWS